MTTCMLLVLYVTGSDIYGRVVLFNHTLAASCSREFLTDCNTHFITTYNLFCFILYIYICMYIPMTLRPIAGHGLLILEVSRSHNDALQSVEFLWTSDQPVAETHNTRTDRHPYLQWDSNPQSPQASGRRPTP